MTSLLNQLSELLTLEKIDANIFRGYSQNIGTGMLYGGQVFAQAISAAQASVEGRQVHSAHAYFLRAGDHNAPVIYIVDASRDGRSYSSRTVSAIQHGSPIFTMMCSFQVKEESEFSFVDKIDYEPFKQLQWLELNLEHDHQAERINRSLILNKQPFSIRFLEEASDRDLRFEHYWMKTNDVLPAQSDLHQSLFSYASDFRLLTSTLRSVGFRYKLKEVMLATICHAVWFHREFNMDQWLFTQCEPLSVANGRGIAKGKVYNEDGILVATTMQEGVVRRRQQ
ncbi:MAG: acyl-CoA thioesterase domain-containing protein [Pseudomonadota bacterium]